MSFNDVSFTDVSFNTVQYPLDTSLCYPYQITTCTDISNNTSDISLSTPPEMDSSCSACSSFQISVQIPCLDASTVDDTSMITMDMSGYGYNIQTVACKNDDGILVQTNITVCDQSCQDIVCAPIYITPELNDFSMVDDEVIEKDYIPEIRESLSKTRPNSSGNFVTCRVSSEEACSPLPHYTVNNKRDISSEIESDDKNKENESDENSVRYVAQGTGEYTHDNEDIIVEESFSEFTQSIHSATSKLRKKITHFIHFPKDMKK